MRWFKEKINDHVKTLVDDIVAAYVERSKLCHQFLLVKPTVTDTEMAVLWAACWGNVEEARAKDDPSNESRKALHDVTVDFLNSFFQGYISTFCQSNLKLDSQSAVIRASIAPTLEAMSSERLTQTGEISAASLSNALKLAGATIAILSADLNHEQGKVATNYAFSLVANESTLQPFQREEVKEWITRNSWAMTS